MNEDTFHRIIDQLAEIKYSGTLMYHLYNEPLHDKRLPEFISYATKKLPQAVSRVCTNGDFLDMEMADKLIASGTAEIAVTDHNKVAGILASKLKSVIAKYPEYIHVNRIAESFLNNRGGAVILEKESTRDNCIIVYEEVKIDYQGNVLLCTADFYRSKIFGNINREHIIDIWKHPEYIRIRKNLRRGIADLAICRACSNLKKSKKLDVRQ
ncbi:MAG: hypothetical protein A2096_16595 [Spirochaetes bacterium GWF1_41_5]|nr:MAG: hypothetical protein A2096_16595 [Spirochaetes bacterium GWF1_41_5]